MKKSQTCLFLAMLLFFMAVISLEAFAGASDSAAGTSSNSFGASGSVGAGYGTLCAMPSQCASGKCIRQIDGSSKCGCQYNRECSAGKSCDTASGICRPAGSVKLGYGAGCTGPADCESGYCFAVSPEITPPTNVCGCRRAVQCKRYPGAYK